jgi:2-hydroxychromene-2-carboxylate isomerase
MRGAVAALDSGYFKAYIDAVFKAIWVDSKNMGDMDTVTEVLSNAGLNATTILESTQDAEVKGKLISNTQAAVERGLFGAPTMFVDGEMFFGQDRLQFVEAVLQQKDH